MNKKEQVIEFLKTNNWNNMEHSILNYADQIDNIYNEPNEFEFGEMVESTAFFADNINRKYLCFDGENHWCLDTENDYSAYKMETVRKIKPTIEVELSELIAEYKKSKNIEGDIKVI